MANDTCPHCGASARPERTDEWTCGTTKWGDRVRMSDHCETRQDLAEVTAERDMCRKHIQESGQLGMSLWEEVQLVVAALETARWMLQRSEEERDALKQRIAEAPEVNASIYADGSLAHVEKWWPRDDAPFVWITRVRLVRDDADKSP